MGKGYIKNIYCNFGENMNASLELRFGGPIVRKGDFSEGNERFTKFQTYSEGDMEGEVIGAKPLSGKIHHLEIGRLLEVVVRAVSDATTGEKQGLFIPSTDRGIFGLNYHTTGETPVKYLTVASWRYRTKRSEYPVRPGMECEVFVEGIKIEPEIERLVSPEVAERIQKFADEFGIKINDPEMPTYEEKLAIAIALDRRNREGDIRSAVEIMLEFPAWFCIERKTEERIGTWKPDGRTEKPIVWQNDPLQYIKRRGLLEYFQQVFSEDVPLRERERRAEGDDWNEEEATKFYACYEIDPLLPTWNF